MNKVFKIGSRNSPLAMFQANLVKDKLIELGIKSEISPIHSTGDVNLVQPLYEMNITGVFTKELDVALLNNQIDIAVHSLKDVPTSIPKNISISAILERDYHQDVLVRNPNSTKSGLHDLKVLCGSIRRKAFWLYNYPNVTFDNIRGNVQTRLKKLEESDADATIFSLAGIKRMDLPINYEMIDFMLPAPAQGVICCISRDSDFELNHILKKLHHVETATCVTIEREFLRKLEGGCSSPIGCYAKIVKDRLSFSGQLASFDGKIMVAIKKETPINDFNLQEIVDEFLNEYNSKV
jgi:hydroxymethylbilane synthase